MSNSKGRRHEKPWTAHDVSKLRQYAKDGLPAVEAAEKLGRSHGATRYKAMTEKIRFRSINQPRGVQKKIAPKLSRLRLARVRAESRAAA